MYEGIGRSLGTDYFRIADQLTGEERDYLRRTRDFVDDQVLPVINGYWERAEFPWPLIKELGKLGHRRRRHPGLRLPADEPDRRGLVNMELNRGDGSLGTFLGVQAGLAMQSIAMLGSEEQKQRWLPRMATLEKLGAFALTEPTHGSDSVALETSARRDGDTWVLNGAKEVDRQRHPGRRRRRVGPRRRRQARSRGFSSRRAHPGTTPGAWRARARCARCGRPRSP